MNSGGSEQLDINGSLKWRTAPVVILVALAIVFVGVAVARMAHRNTHTNASRPTPSQRLGASSSPTAEISDTGIPVVAQPNFRLDSAGNSADVAYSFSIFNAADSVVTLHAPLSGQIVPGIVLRAPESGAQQVDVEPNAKTFLTLNLHIQDCRQIPAKEWSLRLVVDEHGRRTSVLLEPPGQGGQAWQRTVAAQYCRF